MTASELTSERVMRALAALGRPAQAGHAVNDRDLPQLLGALLTVAETGILDHAQDVPKLQQVLDGQIRQTAGNEDPAHMFLLAAQRLARTRFEIEAAIGTSNSPDHPFMSLAAAAARLASTMVMLHVTATDPNRGRWSDEDFRVQVNTLREVVAEINTRHEALERLLPPGLA